MHAAVLLLLLFPCCPMQPPVGDWPNVNRAPGCNALTLLDKEPPVHWEAELDSQKNVKWQVRLGSKCYTTPVIAGGRIYIGTNNAHPRNPKIKGDKGILMCFRAKDGKFLWQAVHDKMPSGRVHDWPYEGLRSVPVVEGKRLYYVSNRCELLCVDTEGFHDGKNNGLKNETYRGRTDADIVWRLDMYKQLNVMPHNRSMSSPLIVGDLVFVVTGNGVGKDHINIPSPQAPSFLAVHKRTGKVIWQNNAPTRAAMNIAKGVNRQVVLQKLRLAGKLLLHSQWSSPTYAKAAGQGQVIFPGGDGWLYAFAPKTGELLWKFDCHPKNAPPQARCEFQATPVVHDNHLYIGVGQDPHHEDGVGHFWCLDLKKAVQFGKFNKGRDVSETQMHTARVWHYGGVGNAKQRPAGRHHMFGRTLSTACVHDGLVYVSDLGGVVYCLDAKTGKRYWYDDAFVPIWSSPLYAGGKVYLGTDDETVLVYAHGKRKKLLAENYMDSMVRGVPVVHDGVVYVATETRLWAIGKKWNERTN